MLLSLDKHCVELINLYFNSDIYFNVNNNFQEK
jgi:hypothetical protein